MLTPLDISDLTAAQKKRAIQAILIGQFFVVGGFNMVIPLMAVHYVERLGWAAGTIGVVLALRMFFQQSVTAFFGVLCDRIGPKPLLVTGMILRVIAFIALGYSVTFWPVMWSSMLVALSGSMFEAPRGAALSVLASPQERQRVFAAVGVSGGIGTAIGTQIGAILVNSNFTWVCIAGAIAFLVVLGLMVFGLPHFRVNLALPGRNSLFSIVQHDRVFMLFVLLLAGHWFAWSQFGLTVTLVATDVAGSTSAVAWIFLVQTIVTVLFGYSLPKWLARWWTSLDLLIYGTAIMGLGLLMIAWSGTVALILIASAVFSLGTVVARPGQETVTANLSDPAARGAYFGVASWALAFGGGLGSYTGGAIYDWGMAHNPAVPWVLFALVAAVSSVGMWLWRGPLGADRTAHPQRLDRSVEATQTARPSRVSGILRDRLHRP